MPLWHRTEWKKAPLPLKPFMVRKIRAALKRAGTWRDYAEIYLQRCEQSGKNAFGTKRAADAGGFNCQQHSGRYRIHVKGALNAGATPEEIRETLYQCTPYVGFARSKAALIEMQIAFEEAGVKLPLENQGTTTDADRIAKGEQTQVDIFGDRMRGFANSGKGDQAHINNWLSGNCFGDYYTRTGLDDAQREMITLCLLIAQVGASRN